MVKSVPMKDHSIVLKPKRRQGIGIVLLLVAVLFGGVVGAGVGVFAPASLALSQEQMLGVLHGGVTQTIENTFVDACAQVPGADGPRAVTRTIRTTYFQDGTSLAVTFASRPTQTNAQC